MIPFNSILVTGGAGFIGVNFIRSLFGKNEFQGKIINLDLLTYAGNRFSLADIEAKFPDRYRFVHGSVTDKELVNSLLVEESVDCIVHFAAESHVDRSIVGPSAFIETNILGTFVLLEAARSFWADKENVRFHHVSTDEVFGSLEMDEQRFTEETAYDPRSPYSASKASSDHLVRSYWHTYNLPISISNCSNNYGPYQFPEKLIPLMLLNMRHKKPLPVYGTGQNVRDWLYVADHSEAILRILANEVVGATYVVGGENEWSNIDLIKTMCRIVAPKLGRSANEIEDSIQFVKDRPGHDMRYSIDSRHIREKIGWKPSVTFEEGLERTIDWYFDNIPWIESIQSGEYRKWLEVNYANRG